jgi:hypothetical protein
MEAAGSVVARDTGLPRASLAASSCAMMRVIDGRCVASCCQHCPHMSRNVDGVSIVVVNV